VPLTYLLIAINVAVSLLGFTRMNNVSGGRMATFSPFEVASGKNYQGMLLSHFSHGDATHLLFNMVTLYSFGPVVEEGLGPLMMLLIYVVAGIASGLVIYYRHRSDPNYRALGASDSVTAIVFAAIVLFPEMSVGFFLIPIPISAPVFAIAYIVISTFLMRRGGGHISHEAHLAGAFSGLVLSGLLAPNGFGPLLRRIQDLIR
jgi:membrane associated rhomboid family serine protease